jgi:hypothetical protein
MKGKTLAKALHTLTVVERVAVHLIESQPGRYAVEDAAEVAYDALSILGYIDAIQDGASTDLVTVCVMRCRKALEARPVYTAQAVAA